MIITFCIVICEKYTKIFLSFMNSIIFKINVNYKENIMCKVPLNFPSSKKIV